MRLICLPLVLILGTSVVVAANAPTSVSGASTNTTESSPTKIGVLDWNELLMKAPQAEEAAKRLEKEFQGRKDALIAKQKTFQTKQEKLTRDKDVMAAGERKEIENELANLQQDVRHLNEKLGSDYNARQREEMDDFLSIVRKEVDAFAKDNEYRLVIPKDATIYTADSIDVTDTILESLKKAKASAKPKTDDSKSKK